MFAIHYAFQFFFGFFSCGIVVGRFEIVLDHLKIVVGRCGSLWDFVTTTSIYLQIVCISSRFRVLHLLSWEFEQSEMP